MLNDNPFWALNRDGLFLWHDFDITHWAAGTGTYLNPGNYKFQEVLASDIYVDKTGLLKYTNSVQHTTTKIKQ